MIIHTLLNFKHISEEIFMYSENSTLIYVIQNFDKEFLPEICHFVISRNYDSVVYCI